jgi:hypothetical protein
MTAKQALIQVMRSVKDDLVWIQTGCSLSPGEHKTVQAAIKRIEDALVADSVALGNADDGNCTCEAPVANPADTEPAEIMRNRRCASHGDIEYTDPDRALEDRRCAGLARGRG